MGWCVAFTLLPGIYECLECGHPLFSSKAKYAHHTPWPAFSDTVLPNSLKKIPETESQTSSQCLALKVRNPRQAYSPTLLFMFHDLVLPSPPNDGLPWIMCCPLCHRCYVGTVIILWATSLWGMDPGDKDHAFEFLATLWSLFLKVAKDECNLFSWATTKCVSDLFQKRWRARPKLISPKNLNNVSFDKFPQFTNDPDGRQFSRKHLIGRCLRYELNPLLLVMQRVIHDIITLDKWNIEDYL